MPGVLMLEAMTQAGSWLIRAGEDFAHSIVVLKEARNVKYNNFVAPGQTLTVTAEIVSHDDRLTKLKAQGTVDGEVQLSGRLVLERYNLADERLGTVADDERVRAIAEAVCPVIPTDLKPMADAAPMPAAHRPIHSLSFIRFGRFLRDAVVRTSF